MSEARLRAAAALRALNHAFVGRDADADVLARITSWAVDAAARLQTGAVRDRAALLPGHLGRMFGLDPVEADQDAANPMADRAVGGPGNPLSADLDVDYGQDGVVVRTTLGAAYEGAPGRAHGGMVAALFDDITGFLLPLAGTPAYTGQLTVRYARPVPIGEVLEFRAAIERHHGRKLHVTAQCRAGDETVATAEVLFITVERSRFGHSAR
ncbi:MAG TPA: PaaI family thioesterase [Acidimicrobiales bacterium]|nr:PaaI family thioesterase [Acidimicrobiales bacterium]